MDKNKVYSMPTIVLHWTVAVLFVGLLSVGFYLDYIPKGPELWQMISLHKSFGVILLLLAVTRLGWRLKEGALPTQAMPKWQRIAAKAVQHTLLLMTLVMPISGMLMSIGAGYGVAVFGLTLVGEGEKIEWMQNLGSVLHHNLPWFLVALLGLHLLGAFKHHVLLKDRTLKNMIGVKS